MRFVLVHGASHGAWCWDLLVPELKRLGHEAVAFDLPGAGTRAGEAATLGGYRDAVVEQLQGGDILVGHSMGAAVAVVAADARPDLIGHITLLSGPLPVEGECLSYQSTSPSVGGSTSDEELESVSEDNMTFTDDGAAFYWDRDGAYATFYQDCDEDLVDWAAERLLPQPLGPVVEPISVPRFWAADLPRSYLMCLQGPGLAAARRPPAGAADGGAAADDRLVALPVPQSARRTGRAAGPGGRHHADRPAHPGGLS